MLAGIVAFFGILSALLAIELERARELSVLRTLGFTPGGLGATLLTQTGLLGLAAGLAAAPIGTALAWLLVHVINRRSFGWTMDFVLTPQALASGVFAGRHRGTARRDLSGLARRAASSSARRCGRIDAAAPVAPCACSRWSAACSDVARGTPGRAAAHGLAASRRRGRRRFRAGDGAARVRVSGRSRRSSQSIGPNGGISPATWRRRAVVTSVSS